MIIVILYILIIIIIGLYKKVNIMESFTDGVKSSYKTLQNLLPSIMFFVLGVNIFLNSGVIEILEAFCERLNLNSLVFIQLILRPISNSSSLIMMTKVFEQYGVDSLIGKISSVIQSVTDTSLYIIIIYFGAVGIKQIGKPLSLALIINILTMVTSIVFSYIIFSFF